MTIGERITALRIAAGLSQNELARRSGVPQTYISLLARGVNDNPGAETVIKLAEALHTTIDYLLTGRQSQTGVDGWDGTDRRSSLRETYRALLAQEPNIDAQTLAWLDRQFASFVEQVGEDRRRVRQMAERAALAGVNDGSFKAKGGSFKTD